MYGALANGVEVGLTHRLIIAASLSIGGSGFPFNAFSANVSRATCRPTPARAMIGSWIPSSVGVSETAALKSDRALAEPRTLPHAASRRRSRRGTTILVIRRVVPDVNVRLHPEGHPASHPAGHPEVAPNLAPDAVADVVPVVM